MKLKIYSLPTFCSQCNRAKSWAEKNLKPDEFEVLELGEKERKFARQNNLNSAPIVILDETEFHCGFQPNKLIFYKKLIRNEV